MEEEKKDEFDNSRLSFSKCANRDVAPLRTRTRSWSLSRKMYQEGMRDDLISAITSKAHTRYKTISKQKLFSSPPKLGRSLLS